MEIEGDLKTDFKDKDSAHESGESSRTDEMDSTFSYHSIAIGNSKPKKKSPVKKKITGKVVQYIIQPRGNRANKSPRPTGPQKKRGIKATQKSQI